MNWQDARTSCKKLWKDGLGDIATPKGSLLHQFLQKIINNVDVWIGAQYNSPKKDWYWTDGCSLHSGYNSIKPDYLYHYKTTQHCLKMHKNGTWAVSNCGNTVAFACQKSEERPRSVKCCKIIFTFGTLW